MSLIDNLGDLLKQATGGNASDDEVHGAYDQVAANVPQGDLAGGIAHAFNSDKTPPFEEMVSQLFDRSTPEQKAGILNHILGSLGPAGAAAVAAAGPSAGALTGGNVTPMQATEVSPATVQVLAQQAAAKDPSVVDAAAGFYAAHPTLVKALGAGALALLMAKLSQNRR